MQSAVVWNYDSSVIIVFKFYITIRVVVIPHIDCFFIVSSKYALSWSFIHEIVQLMLLLSRQNVSVASMIKILRRLQLYTCIELSTHSSIIPNMQMRNIAAFSIVYADF